MKSVLLSAYETKTYSTDLTDEQWAKLKPIYHWRTVAGLRGGRTYVKF